MMNFSRPSSPLQQYVGRIVLQLWVDYWIPTMHEVTDATCRGGGWCRG